MSKGLKYAGESLSEIEKDMYSNSVIEIANKISMAVRAILVSSNIPYGIVENGKAEKSILDLLNHRVNKEVLKYFLELSDGNQAQVSRNLGVNRGSVMKMVRYFDL